MNDASAQLFAFALAATWCGFGLYGVMRTLGRSPRAREMLRLFWRSRLCTKAAIIAGLVAVVAVGGTKPGGTNDPLRGLRSPPGTVAVEPAFAPVEVHTTNVVFRVESASAVEMEDWRKHGSSSGGVWLDFEAPVFRLELGNCLAAPPCGGAAGEYEMANFLSGFRLNAEEPSSYA